MKLLPWLCEIKLHGGEVVVRVRCAGSRDGAARCCSRLVVAGVGETLQVCEGRRCVVVADEMKRCGNSRWSERKLPWWLTEIAAAAAVEGGRRGEN